MYIFLLFKSNRSKSKILKKKKTSTHQITNICKDISNSEIVFIFHFGILSL